MDKAIVAQRIATKVASTEDAVDLAMTEAAALLSEMLNARRELGLPATFGDKSVQKVSEAAAALSAARQAVVEAHNELHEMQLRLGVRTKAISIDTSFFKADESTKITARKVA